jgi:hypothetical protein
MFLYIIKMKSKRDKENIDFVKDGYTSEKIIEVIKEVREKYNIDNNEMTENDKKDYQENYKFFIERYPFLSDMAIKKDINYDTLYYMLDLRNKIIDNTMSFEDASKKVGNDMFDKYQKN